MNQIPFFKHCHHILMAQDIHTKVQQTQVLYEAMLNHEIIYDSDTPVSPEIIAIIPEKVQLVEPKFLLRRRVQSIENRASLIHAILHIEYNAINLAIDAAYRFRHMPEKYYQNWIKIAREEAYHFSLLLQYLNQLGYDYGDFPAHNGLWEMAQKTGYDVLVRMALVPRLLEARGLDVTPDIAKRLRSVGDEVASGILGIIFNDEIGHVAIGNYWYHYLCLERKIDPLDTFAALLKEHAPDYVRGPLGLETRRKAGFDDSELDLLKKLVEIA